MQTLRQFQLLFEAYLKDRQFNGQPEELYAPVNYILSLGGKRMRPIFVMLSYALFDEEIKKALPIAYAIEIFHNFSLAHDDIMDEAPLRRGKPSVHSKFGINSGILSGDVMLIKAYECLSMVDNKKRIPDLYKVFNQVATEVCEGQQYDMNFEERKDVSIQEYLRMIELKTAVLVAGGMQMGALAADASDSQALLVAEFGRNIGIAFQLQDDILDTFGDSKKFGKKIGGDIAQNKKSYLFLKAIELANPSQRDEIEYFYTTTSSIIDEAEKIRKVSSLFERLNVRQEAEIIKENYLKKAFDHLDAISVTEERKTPLKKLANDLMSREK